MPSLSGSLPASISLPVLKSEHSQPWLLAVGRFYKIPTTVNQQQLDHGSQGQYGVRFL